MPIQPPVLEYRCPTCGWRGVTAPTSDVLGPFDIYYSRCPKCGSEDLRTRRLSRLEAWLVRQRRKGRGSSF